jgi:hypothetical protein
MNGGETRRDVSLARLLESAQRIFARIDDLEAFLDLVALTAVELIEEIDGSQAKAEHLLGATGILSRDPGDGVFRPLRLQGRPDPVELRSFVEHVGPGDSEHPTGLMGWAAARRKVALRRGSEWLAAERDDSRDRWADLRLATEGERREMERAAIAAYPSIHSQLAVPVLDPMIRGQARPRDAVGILNVESDACLTDECCALLIAFGGSIGHPLTAALRRRDVRRLSRRLALPLSRSTLAQALLDVTLPYLPGRASRGFVAIRDFRRGDCFPVEAITTGDLSADTRDAFRARRLTFGSADGLCGQAIRTRRAQYLPDLQRRRQEYLRPFWSDSRSALVIPMVSGDIKECVGLLALESGETSYAFASQDITYFRTAAAIATVAVAGVREPSLDYPEAVDTAALAARLRRSDSSGIPDDQIVRINSICRALIMHGFVFQKAAEESRLSVHVLREYTSRAPRVIDVEALRALAARREEILRVASHPDTWELHDAA